MTQYIVFMGRLTGNFSSDGNSCNFYCNRGFTLIELLVVMAVLAVLGAIITPAYSSFRQQASKTVCASNLKQVVLAWVMYCDNNDSKACKAYEYKDSFDYNWYCKRHITTLEADYKEGHLSPYLKIDNEFGCTLFKKMPHHKKGFKNYIGYGYNTTYIGKGQFEGSADNQNLDPINISQINNFSRTIVFAEVAYWEECLGHPYHLKPNDYLRSPDERELMQSKTKKFNWYQSGTVHFRHNGFANVAFVDGHVKMIKDQAYLRPHRTAPKDQAFGAIHPSQGIYKIKED